MHILKRTTRKGYKSDGLRVDINAGDLTNQITEAVLEITLSNMDSGREPDGTPKPAKSRRDGYPRGVTERRRFVDSISRRKARGKTKAKAAITYAQFFRPWLRKEETRGVDHFSIPDDVIDATVKKYLQQAIK